MPTSATVDEAGSPTVGRRWMGTGAGSSADPDAAVAEALAQARTGPDPALCVVFASPTTDLDAVARSVRERLGDVPVVGCSTAGDPWTGGTIEHGVVLTFLGGPGFSVATGLGRTSGRSLRGAAADAARCITSVEQRGHTVLLLIADGLCGDQMEVVRGAYEVAGAAVPLVGGCAGADPAMATTRVLHGAEVTDRAVVAAAISSDAPLGIGLGHGWRTVGEPAVVTASSATTVGRLDDRPALDVYLERCGAPGSLRRHPGALSDFAATRPIGVRRRNRIEIRHVTGADTDTGELHCIAEVPPGALVYVMEGDIDSILDATTEACVEAIGALAGRPAIGLLAFDCVARRAVVAPSGLHGEVDRVIAAAQGVPVAGCYTYGEIARTRGAGGFHNQTVVVMAVS
jgi:hypothetical protein